MKPLHLSHSPIGDRPGLMLGHSRVAWPDATHCALRVNVSYISQKAHLSIETIIHSFQVEKNGWVCSTNEISPCLFLRQSSRSSPPKQTKDQLRLTLHFSKPKFPYHLLGSVNIQPSLPHMSLEDLTARNLEGS